MKIAAADAVALHSARWRELEPLARLDRYLRTLDIPIVESQEVFDKHAVKLHKRHGAAWERVGRLIQARADGDLTGDIYTAKNSSLELSLGVSALAVGVYRGLFSQIRGFTPAPKAIIDIGCENGLIACYLALLYPDARVVGVDPSEPAIRCARELAELLGIKSIQFHVGTITSVGGAAGKDFDIALALTVFQDAGAIPDHGEQEACVGFESKNHVHPLPDLEAIRSVMSPTGFWISIERCRYPTDFAWWVEAIHASGWVIDWRHSHKLDCSSKGRLNELPLVVARQHSEVPTQIDRTMIQAVWLSATFAANKPSGPERWVFRDEEARAFRAAIRVETIHRRALANTDEDPECIEVATTGPFAFFFEKRSQGPAFMRWTVLTHLDELLDEWQRSLDEIRRRHGSDAVNVELEPTSTQ